MIELPTANDSITNKQATQKESIYHTCRSVLNALNYVEGFHIYMEDINNGETDPLTKLWHICRQGSSLCYLYNTLKPDSPIMITKSSSAANKSKAYVYHFIIACRDQLHFPEDTLFTVTELFQNDTNKLVKVVNTVKRILDLLEQEGIIQVKCLQDDSTTGTPKDMRDNVVFELISTERKYVQDLEALQNYMKEVSAQDILSQDTMHYLFGNLNALVDFQRRFLIQMEEQVAHSPKEQRFGSLFIHFEDAFSVYEPFCANFQIAQDLVIQEAPKLQKVANIMSPEYELPAMLIKPIQRVCKYPLLIQQLVKSTPEDWPHVEETKHGLEVIQRITKKVNETKRFQENILLVQDLRKRIVDDNSTNPLLIVDSAGQLLLHDRFTLQKHDTDHLREMQVFLFEKIILVCKEYKETNKNTITIKKKRKEGALVVRGKILLSRIEHVKGSSSQNGSYTLHLSWLEGDLQTILLKCRNDEQLRQWLDVIIDLKKSSTKLDFFSTPQTPRMDQNNPLLHYDEDDDDDDDEYEENSDNEDIPIFMRNRSQSYQYHRYPEITSRKASLSSTNSRHLLSNTAPPPLPRSPSANTMDSTLYSLSNMSFPSSPPVSYPPSPTATTTSNSNRSSSTSHEHTIKQHNILPSGSLWQRRQNHKDRIIEEDEEDQSEQTPSKPFYPHHMRARSQSTPNIIPQQRPPLSSTDTSLGSYYEHSKEYPSSSPASPNPDTTKLKIHYFGAIYVVVVPTTIGFTELVKRIESKIKVEQDSLIGLKYEDEDGDLITISSSEDVQMGFENRGPSNAVNIYVT